MMGVSGWRAEAAWGAGLGLKRLGWVSEFMFGMPPRSRTRGGCRGGWAGACGRKACRRYHGLPAPRGAHTRVPARAERGGPGQGLPGTVIPAHHRLLSSVH